MSNLDRNLRCANALTGIGTVKEAVEALEPERVAGATSLFRGLIVEALDEAKSILSVAAKIDEATIAQYREAEELQHKASDAVEPSRLLFDAAVAKRLELVDPTIESVEAPVAAATAPSVAGELSLAQPAHLPVLFPEVFLGSNAGFSCIIGNPPWKPLEVDVHAWWGQRFPGLHRGLNVAARNPKIERLAAERPDLAAEYEEEIALTNQMRKTIVAGPFPGITTGDADLYKAFCWRDWQVLRSGGRLGIVLPRTALMTKGSAKWLQEVLANGTFEDVVTLTNSREWVFAGIDERYSIGLVVAAKGTNGPVRFAGPFYDRASFDSRAESVPVPREEFSAWTPDALFPSIPNATSSEVMRLMKLHQPFNKAERFGFRPVQGDMNATTNKKTGIFSTDTDSPIGDIPVWTGAAVDIWSASKAEPYGFAEESVLVPHLLEKTKKATRNRRSAFFGLKVETADDLPFNRARVALLDVTSPTNTRSALFCLVPPRVALVNAAPFLVRTLGDETDEAFLLGVACSIPFDWFCRRWIELHLNFFILDHFPVRRPASDDARRERVVELAGRLAATDDRYSTWAEAVGVPVGSLDAEDERTAAMAELDALSAHLYGLSESHVHHIFETFHHGWDYSDRMTAVLKHYGDWEYK